MPCDGASVPRLRRVIMLLAHDDFPGDFAGKPSGDRGHRCGGFQRSNNPLESDPIARAMMVA
jgi:hypothetical protein